jgi:hypothetical protein
LNFARVAGLVDEARFEDLLDGRNVNKKFAGSITDNSLESICRAWETLFTAMPLLPRSVSRWLVRSGNIRWLRSTPTALLIMIDLVNLLRSGDALARAYLRYYAHHCALFLERRTPVPIATPLRWFRHALEPRYPN